MQEDSWWFLFCFDEHNDIDSFLFQNHPEELSPTKTHLGAKTHRI